MTDIEIPADLLIPARAIAREFAAAIDPEIEHGLMYAVAKALAVERRRHIASGYVPALPDFLSDVQSAARRDHEATWGAPLPVGTEFTGSASVETPRGILEYFAWREARATKTGKADRWAGRYALNGVETSVRRLRELGLNQKRITKFRISRGLRG